MSHTVSKRGPTKREHNALFHSYKIQKLAQLVCAVQSQNGGYT